MRVGILTYHWIYNLGANLQTLATQEAVKSFGHEPVVVNYRSPTNNLGGAAAASTLEQESAHDAFVGKYLRESEVLRSNEEVRSYCLDSCDALLVGSDTVFEYRSKYDPYTWWKLVRTGKLQYTKDVPPFFLDWKRPRDSIYAASVSACGHGTHYQFTFGDLRNRLRRGFLAFDKITVRDDWTAKMVRHITRNGIAVQVAPDPIFSLHRTFNIPEEEKIRFDLSNVVLVSGPFAEEWLTGVATVLKQRGLRLWGLANPERPYEYRATERNIGLPLSPIHWYQYLGQAAGYIGVRFHALVSCLAQETPIVHTDPYRRSEWIKEGSKFYDLCKRANILERYQTVRSVQKMEPEEVVAVLFDRKTQERANSYAGAAGVEYLRLIQSVLYEAELRGGGRTS